MDIRVLEYFLMAAREENITKAAQLLHVTQPTLSRQLMQLEDELGVKLFERTNHSVLLTDEGFLFRRRAQDIVAMAEKAKSEVTQNEETLSGIISIGCNELRSVQELAQAMTAFQSRYPRVKFELYSGSNEEIQERIEQGSLDIGLFLEPFNLTKYATLSMQMKERWGALIHREAALAAQDTIHPGDLVGTLVMTIHVNTPAHMELRQWSGDFAKDMDFSANYNVLHNAVIVARERKGAVICLEQDCHYDDMKFLPLEPELSVGSALAWKEGRIVSRAAKAFLQFLQQQEEEAKKELENRQKANDQQNAIELENKGNELLAEGKYENAITFYQTAQAIYVRLELPDLADGINGKIAAARAGIEAAQQAEEEAQRLAREQENTETETKEYGPGAGVQ